MRDVRVDIEPVIVPEIDVDDRSLAERKVRGVNEGRVMGEGWRVRTGALGRIAGIGSL